MNWTADTTPPVAIASGFADPDNGAAAAAASGFAQPDNTAPAVIVPVGLAPDLTAPVAAPAGFVAAPAATAAIASGFAEPNNAAAVEIATVAFMPAGVAPVSVAAALPDASNAAPSTFVPAGFTPAGGGAAQIAPVGLTVDKTAPTAADAAFAEAANLAADSIAGRRTAATQDAAQPYGYAPIIPVPTDATMHLAPLQLTGKPAVNQVFGFYKAPANIAVKGVQFFAQTPPTGAAFSIELVDAEGNSLARTADLPAGDAFREVTFLVPLPLIIGSVVRAKITQVGSGNAGGYITASLVVQLT